MTASPPAREHLLAVAEALFERYGYKKTTVEDIAHEAGVGKGTVYLHFASKEEIGMAWLSKLHGEIEATLRHKADIADPQQALRSFLAARVMLRFEIFSRHRRSMDEALATLGPQLREKRERFHAAEAEIAARIIRRGIDSGAMATADPEEDARSMVTAMNALLPYSVRPDLIGNREQVEHRADRLADLLARGVTA